MAIFVLLKNDNNNMNTTNTKISIVIPLYNEEESIVLLHTEILKTTENLLYTFEYIYVNDGSTDKSLSILKKLKNDYNNISIINFKKNFGKSIALSTGFSEANGNMIITIDADLQDNPNEIPRFIKKINEGYDLVSGWKKDRKDPIVKLISSKIFNLTVSKLSKLKLNDFNCGYKIYKKEVIEHIKVYGELHRFLPVLAHEKGFKVGEIIVDHKKREFGESKYGNLGLSRLKNYLLDPINVILITKYSKKPIHFFGNFGLIIFTLGFSICTYLTLIWLFTEQAIGNRPLLFLGILMLIVGIQLISFGLLGEIIVSEKPKNTKEYYFEKF